MKKEIMVLLIFLSYLTISCSSQHVSEEIDNSLGGKLFLNATGNIYVKQSNDKSLLLLFRTKGVSSATFDKSLIIYSETEIPKLALNESELYEIKISESRKFAILYNLNRNKIYFIGTMDSQNEIDVIKGNTALKNSIDNLDYLGYGFSYLTGSWSESRIKESRYTTPIYSLDYSDNFNTQLRTTLPLDDDGGGGGLCAQGSCTSGGNGSSSCSITEAFPSQSCNVTCTTGFYACCNSKSVRCYCCKY